MIKKLLLVISLAVLLVGCSTLDRIKEANLKDKYIEPAFSEENARIRFANFSGIAFLYPNQMCTNRNKEGAGLAYGKGDALLATPSSYNGRSLGIPKEKEYEKFAELYIKSNQPIGVLVSLGQMYKRFYFTPKSKSDYELSVICKGVLLPSCYLQLDQIQKTAQGISRSEVEISDLGMSECN